MGGWNPLGTAVERGAPDNLVSGQGLGYVRPKPPAQCGAGGLPRAIRGGPGRRRGGRRPGRSEIGWGPVYFGQSGAGLHVSGDRAGPARRGGSSEADGPGPVPLENWSCVGVDQASPGFVASTRGGESGPTARTGPPPTIVRRRFIQAGFFPRRVFPAGRRDGWDRFGGVWRLWLAAVGGQGPVAGNVGARTWARFCQPQAARAP